MTGGVDAAAYLRHVGLPVQGATPTVATLRRLHRAHVDAIPFTSVTTALGRVPALDLPTLQRRMVAEHRGGYCLEHVTLFAAVLEALGFATDVRLCRVGDPAQVDEGRPPTHLTVLARPIDDPRRWMADVGFGVGVLGPVPVPQAQGEGEPVRHGSWEHRADVIEDGRILLLERDAGDWRPLHTTFDRDIDASTVGEANRWVALQPGSPFAGRLVAMRTTDDLRERLIGTRLERAPADGEPTTDELTPAEALDALQRHFGVAVVETDREALADLLGGGSDGAPGS
jgi:N-hydroxyarylamine O-acetyltransferase